MNSIEKNLLVSKGMSRRLIGIGFDIRQMVNINGFTGILYSQAFDWFRVEHGLVSSINPITLYYWIGSLTPVEIHGTYDDKDTYESARIACLEKLIELVTEKKK